MTPSRAKNAIRRSLRDLADPPLSDSAKHQIWEYFGSECVYCGAALLRSERKGHIDHLVSCSVGGTNHASNRVLSCGACNGDEKRDAPWDSFLKRKAADPATFSARHAKMQAWVAQNPIVAARKTLECMEAEMAKR